MKIVYSPHYDVDIYLGEAPRFIRKRHVGNNWLLAELQLRAGVHIETVSDVERETAYHNAMKGHTKGTMFEKVAEVDSYGTAVKLLRWRDALIMAGWDGECSLEEGKLEVLAAIEKDFKGAKGTADCWREVCETYEKIVDVREAIEEIDVDCPWSEIPYLIRKTLDAIGECGIAVNKLVDENIAEQPIDIDKIKLVEFDDVNEAYEWFTKIGDLGKDTVVINRDNVRLNHILFSWDKPLLHSTQRDSNPQLLQLFKLCLCVFSRPLDIRNLVSYLMLNHSPIPGKVRYGLARLLLKTGGFGEKKVRDDNKIRDEWEEIIKAFDWKEGKKGKKSTFIDPIRNDYTNGLDKVEIVKYVDELKKWVHAILTNEESKISDLEKIQFGELNKYLKALQNAIEPLSKKVDYEELEALVMNIYRPMNYSMQAAEEKSSNVIGDIRAIATESVNTLLWLDCQEELTEADEYDFLSSDERDLLNNNGCEIPDFANHLIQCRRERNRMLAKCERIVLVRSKYNGTTRLGEHSIVSEAKQLYKKKYGEKSELKPVEANGIFGKKQINKIEGNTEKLEPVLALELDKIDYKGRKESNTSLDTLINLPFNYVMEHIAKLPKPDDEQLKSMYVTTGEVAHCFFENLTNDSNKDVSRMKQLVKYEFEKRLQEAIETKGLIMLQKENVAGLNEFRKQLKGSIDAFINIMQNKGWKPVGCEMNFPEDKDESITLGKIDKFGARIDMLLKDADDKYVIIDFKWSYSKSYGEKLEKNLAIQLELYRQTVKTKYEGKDVSGVGYYLMPKRELHTTDFEEIAGSKLIKKVVVNEDRSRSNLFTEIQNSYEYRMDELKKGHIEEGETMELLNTGGYYAEKGLCPLNVKEKKKQLSAIKESEMVFKPSKKKKFPKNNEEPSEIATSHAILKGRLK